MNWTGFKKRYVSCKDCDLCQVRNKIVLAKGTIPCDVLFVGEAPGSSEDILGKPFVGPAGKLLHRIVDSAMKEVEELSTAFTNLICCIPKEDGQKIKEPKKEHIHACAHRLRDFTLMCNPALIVFVGKLAEKHGSDLFMCDKIVAEAVCITHPATVLKSELPQREFLAQRMEAKLIDAFRNVPPF